MGSRAANGGGWDWAQLLLPCCGMTLLSLTGAGRALLGCPPGALGSLGPRSTASGAALLLLLLPALCTGSELLCCRRWGGSGVD